MFVYNAMMTCLGWSPTYVYHFKGVFLSLDVTLSSQLQPNIVMLSQWAKTTTSHFLPPKITSTNSKCDKTAEWFQNSDETWHQEWQHGLWLLSRRLRLRWTNWHSLSWFPRMRNSWNSNPSYQAHLTLLCWSIDLIFQRWLQCMHYFIKLTLSQLISAHVHLVELIWSGPHTSLLKYW